MNDNAQSFQAAYQTLQQNAEYLEQNDTLDIDGLVAIVDNSIQAYKVCQSRINAVETALKEAFINNDADE